MNNITLKFFSTTVLHLQVQEDLQQLKDALIQKNHVSGSKGLDISSLESAIEKTEDGIKVNI